MPNESVTACCECTPVLETQFGGDEELSASQAIVEAVTALDGGSFTQRPPLYETIDPDALDQLCPATIPSSQPRELVQFVYAGWNIFVRNDGTIRVCDPDRPTEPAPAFQKPLAEG